ncbi:phosphoglycerate mutase family protein, partial [Oceanicola granulosus HTCC2516]
MALDLLLIRHAKSDWDDPDADDHARVLNPRGRRSARAIGRWLAERGAPGEVLCSDAARTLETWELIAAELPGAPLFRALPELYLASPAVLMAQLAAAEARRVALIAHNPGIGHLASSLVRAPAAHPRYQDYPTCATALIRFEAESWGELRPGAGQVVDFVVPRELT